MLATWETQEGDCSLKPALGKNVRPYLKNNLKQIWLGSWLKWFSKQEQGQTNKNKEEEGKARKEKKV
jgi:hypothetical protein